MNDDDPWLGLGLGATVVLVPPPPVNVRRKLLSVLAWLSVEVEASWAMMQKSSMTSSGGKISGQVTSFRVNPCLDRSTFSRAVSLDFMVSFSSRIFLSLAVVDWYWARRGTRERPLPPAWPRTEENTSERKLKSESIRVSCHCRVKYGANVGLDSGLGKKGSANQSFHSGCP